MFRDVIRKVAKNTSIMLFQQVITWGSTFLLMLFLPRYLGPVEYGRLFLAGSITYIFRVFVEYGGSFLVSKSVSRSKDITPQILVDAISFRFLFGGLAFACIIVFSFLFDYSEEVRLILVIFGLTVLWRGAITVLYACYQGHELMQYTSAGAIAEAVFMSLVGVGALLLGARATVIAVVSTISCFLNFLVLAIFAKRIVPALPRINWRGVLEQINRGAPYFLFTVFGVIYNRIVSVMLSKMTPETVVGWYGGAIRLYEALNFLPFIFTSAVYPVLSRFWKEGEETHKRTAQKGLEFMLITGIPISIAVVAFADEIIRLFYGIGGYGPSVSILKILSGGLILLYLDMVLGTTLLASDKQKQLSMVSLVAIPVNILLNYFLIPYYQTHEGNGAIGAAIATVLTELYVFVAALNLLPKGILSGFPFMAAVKSVFSGAIMALFLWLMREFGSPWFVQAFLCPCVYLGTLFLTNPFEPSEIAFLQELITARKARVMKFFIRPHKAGERIV